MQQDEGVAESVYRSLGFRRFAPETINGRCGMLGFVAGVGAEAATGETLAGQFYSHPLAFALVVALVTYATFVPTAQARRGAYTSDPESLGDIGLFTAAAERTNGRAAMLGLAAMLVAESVTGSALVHL